MFGTIAKSLYMQFKSKITLLIITIVLEIHTCKPILVQMEDAKTIGQNVFVFDNIEQALCICHVRAYLYLLPLHARPWKHLTKHVYLHTLIV